MQAAAESYELVAERRIEFASVFDAGADQATDVARALRLAGYLLTARLVGSGQELAAAADLLGQMRMTDLAGQPWTAESLAEAVRAAERAAAQAQKRRNLDHAGDLLRAARQRMPDTVAAGKPCC